MEFGPFSAEFGVADVDFAFAPWAERRLKARWIVGGYGMPEGIP